MADQDAAAEEKRHREIVKALERLATEINGVKLEINLIKHTIDAAVKKLVPGR